MIKARGILRHRFWGEYSAVVGLEFESAEECTEALRTLGPQWPTGNPKVLARTFDRDELEAFKAQLGTWGRTIATCPRMVSAGKGRKKKPCTCHRTDDIDSIAHFVDYGPIFEVTIPYATVPKEQLALAV